MRTERLWSAGEVPPPTPAGCPLMGVWLHVCNRQDPGMRTPALLCVEHLPSRLSTEGGQECGCCSGFYCHITGMNQRCQDALENSSSPIFSLVIGKKKLKVVMQWLSVCKCHALLPII